MLQQQEIYDTRRQVACTIRVSVREGGGGGWVCRKQSEKISSYELADCVNNKKLDLLKKGKQNTEIA